MSIKITEKLMKSYEINNNGEWATVVIELGEQSAQVIAHSSFGEYAYTWNATGANPLNFLKKISFDYTMSKFKGHYEVYDRAAQEVYLKKQVNELADNVSQELKEDYLFQAEDACRGANSVNSFMTQLDKTDLFEALFDSDYSAVGIALKPDPQCVGFWDNIWKPLMDSIKELEPV